MTLKKDSMIIYAAQSALLWSCIPILWTYLPIYFDLNGYSSTQIGLIMAINPLMAVLTQPFFGHKADMASSKNKVFAFLMVGTIASILLLPISSIFAYALVLGTILSVFQSALIPISESITLERLELKGKDYGPVRLAGTFGFAIASVIASLLIESDIKNIFYLVAIIGSLNILLVFRIPRVVGHEGDSHKASIGEIFNDKQLVVFLIFSLIAMLAMVSFMTFSPLFFLALGGTKGQLGWIFFLSAVSELPFLLNAEKIINKLTIQGTLGLSMGIIGLRGVLVLFIESSWLMFPLALLNGATFIVFAYSLAVYINRTVKKELRTRGQTVLGVSTSFGRIIGALLSGLMVDAMGLKNTMFFSGLVCVAAIFWYILMLISLKKKSLKVIKEGVY
jgi:PPP family 3-phenylpropionic acid transporter